MISPVTRDDGKEIDAGLRAINELLYYNHERYVKEGCITKGNSPRAFWSMKCANSWRAMVGFKRAKQSAVEGSSIINTRFEEELKHGVDILRYILALEPKHIFSDNYRRAMLSADYNRVGERMRQQDDYNPETVYAL